MSVNIRGSFTKEEGRNGLGETNSLFCAKIISICVRSICLYVHYILMYSFVYLFIEKMFINTDYNLQFICSVVEGDKYRLNEMLGIPSKYV